MTKQELIDAANNIDKKYIANSRWYGASPDGKHCKCIFGEILENIGGYEDYIELNDMKKSAFKIAERLQLEGDLVHQTIQAYDHICFLAHKHRYGSDFLPAQEAKEAFMRAVNSVWGDIDNE